MIKVDLHTHSIISADGAGSITASDFERFLKTGVLDCLAITDHNETKFAQEMHQKFGNKIIVGEEIRTKEGEIIGLFLTKTIPPRLTAVQTVKEIREQGGLVYIPHPFEIVREGLQRPILEKIVSDIDIFEVFNGRGRLHGKEKKALAFAEKYHLIPAASSDAHGPKGIGYTYSVIDTLPTKETLKMLLKKGLLHKQYAPLWTYLYPIVNILKNTFT